MPKWTPINEVDDWSQTWLYKDKAYGVPKLAHNLDDAAHFAKDKMVYGPIEVPNIPKEPAIYPFEIVQDGCRVFGAYLPHIKFPWKLFYDDSTSSYRRLSDINNFVGKVKWIHEPPKITLPTEDIGEPTKTPKPPKVYNFQGCYSGIPVSGIYAQGNSYPFVVYGDSKYDVFKYGPLLYNSMKILEEHVENLHWLNQTPHIKESDM